jgi:hypothetical protein
VCVREGGGFYFFCPALVLSSTSIKHRSLARFHPSGSQSLHTMRCLDRARFRFLSIVQGVTRSCGVTFKPLVNNVTTVVPGVYGALAFKLNVRVT